MLFVALFSITILEELLRKVYVYRPPFYENFRNFEKEMSKHINNSIDQSDLCECVRTSLCLTECTTFFVFFSAENFI